MLQILSHGDLLPTVGAGLSLLALVMLLGSLSSWHCTQSAALLLTGILVNVPRMDISCHPKIQAPELLLHAKT